MLLILICDEKAFFLSKWNPICQLSLFVCFDFGLCFIHFIQKHLYLLQAQE